MSSLLTNNIRLLRVTCDKMTQQELADMIGVTRQTIIAIERGNYTPSLVLAFKIAKLFGLNIEQVFTYQSDCL